MALAGYMHSVFIAGVSMFYVMLLLQSFFGSGNYSIVGPYMGELWPGRLRGVKPAATLDALIPGFLYFAFWYVLGAFAFWFIGFETSRRSIAEIDDALGRPVAAAGPGAAARSAGD